MVWVQSPAELFVLFVLFRKILPTLPIAAEGSRLLCSRFVQTRPDIPSVLLSLVALCSFLPLLR